MILSEDNFKLYAFNHYDNPSCTGTEEFINDLSRFRYVKRLCNKYRQTGVLKERLILNHLVTLYNLFGPSCTSMLFLKIGEENWSVIAPFMEALGFMPVTIRDVKGMCDLNTDDIQRNADVKQAIRMLLK